MGSDLIERLRAGLHPFDVGGRFADDSTLTEAADEITALRATIAKLEARLIQARDGRDEYLRARIISALALLSNREPQS